MAALATIVSQFDLTAASAADGEPRVSQFSAYMAYGPAATKYTLMSQGMLLAAYSNGENNVTTDVSQFMSMVAYGSGIPGTQKSAAWTFILDGHRFYVLPLGPEGDWAYDTTTREWCRLQSQGFPGMNFTHGVMWGIRVVGGDALYTYLYELDPNQVFDEEWRPVEHMVTGGLATRSRAGVGVANFTLTASVGDVGEIDQDISLAFSDDNGVTWSPEFPITLTGDSSEILIWNALGSFAAPGRVFRITDFTGPVRLDGTDAVLTLGNGADSGDGQDH